jgi:DNA-binding CsgD family transcriptional regulator
MARKATSGMKPSFTEGEVSFSMGEFGGAGPLDAARPGAAVDPPSAELASIAVAALTAALEAIFSPAFLLRSPSTILQANARGRALLAGDEARVLSALRGVPGGGHGPLRFPLEAPPGHEVVVVPDLDESAHARLAAVARRWALTPRQSAVLALVAQGESNRTVAGHLGCSEKTIELHVSALLAKTRCTNRSQLVASFWTDLG